MAQDTIDKIINIQFNYGELVQGWQKATREIEINKKNLAELKQEYKNGEMSASEYNRALLEITSTTKALTAEKKAYEKEIQNNIKIESQETGSLNQLRASLQKMTAQYNAMSAARREGQEGRLLAASIKSQQEAINEAEMALGNYRSQVGNYENAIKNALPFGNSFLLQLSDSAKQAGSATNMIKGAASAIGSLVKQAASFIATPLGATIAAIYASYKWLSFQIEEVNDRIKENERLTYKQRESLTAAEAWNAAYTQTIDAMGESAIRTTSRLKTLWTQAKIYTKDFFKFGPMATLVFKAQTNAAEELKGVYDQIAAKEKELTLARRDSYEKLAELETKIAEDRLKSNDRQAYSDEQRRQFALDAINATKERYAIIKDIANKELELEELRASTTENSIETNDKLAQMRAGIIRLEAQETNSLRELQERLNETSDKAKQYAKTQLDLEKQLSKSILELRQASLEKDLELSRLRFSWERQELENKLKYDKTLTAESREAINQLILNMEERRYKEESEIRQRWSDKEFEEEARNAENRIKMRFNAQNKLQTIRQKEAQLPNYDILHTSDPNKDIEKNAAKMNIAQQQMDAAQNKLSEIQSMSEETYTALYGGVLEWRNAELDAQKAVAEAKQQVNDIQLQGIKLQEKETQMSIQSAQQMVGALEELAEAAGADAGVVAMLAIAESAAAMGTALHKAFSSSATVWDGIAGAVAAISTITTIITQIKSLNSSAEEERSKYRYASGGLVTGPGTGTSDSIPAMLSNGEAVMTAQAVNDWGAMLSAMNVASGGNAIQVSNLPQRNDGMRGMKAMIREAMLEMPAPIVSVVDINKGQKRVKVQNSLGKLGRKKYE